MHRIDTRALHRHGRVQYPFLDDIDDALPNRNPFGVTPFDKFLELFGGVPYSSVAKFRDPKVRHSLWVGRTQQPGPSIDVSPWVTDTRMPAPASSSAQSMEYDANRRERSIE